jgi:hypothetical protein
MSHFSLLVRIPESKVGSGAIIEHRVELERALDDMLAPYAENQEPDSPYLAFRDSHAGILSDYERYKVQGQGQTLESYAEENGYVLKDGRYGYMMNPNGKWDWWVIGGRWCGQLIRKERGVADVGEPSLITQLSGQETTLGDRQCDIVRVEDYDYEEADRATESKIDNFINGYELSKTGNNDSLFEPHGTLMALGLRVCTQPRRIKLNENGEEVLDSAGKTVFEAAEFYDAPFTPDDLRTKYRWYWEPRTYAVLNENGWHAAGEMGWFGCSSDTPESKAAFCRSYRQRFIEGGNPKDVLVMVDCHT